MESCYYQDNYPQDNAKKEIPKKEERILKVKLSKIMENGKHMVQYRFMEN